MQIDNKRICDAAALTRAVGTSHEAGDKVTLVYERSGKMKTTTAMLAKTQAHYSTKPMNGFNDPGELDRHMPDHYFFMNSAFLVIATIQMRLNGQGLA